MKKVLLVDDDPVIQKLLSEAFSKEGYHVVSALDGLKALDAVRQQMPDLIVLDIMMPGMNGYDVCRIIKHDPELKGIPIILLTSRDLEMDTYLLKTMGIEYVHKTAQPADLVMKVLRAIGP